MADFEHLRVFVAVAEAGGFAPAARRLALPLRIARPLEHHLDACHARPVDELARRDAEPALHRRRAERVARQPASARVVAAGQVDEDGVAVGEGRLAVLDHRHLAEGVHGQEGGRLVGAAGQVDVDALERQAEQREHQLDAMRVARQGEAVQADGHGGASWWGEAPR
jgi:hypothetical protein